MTLCKHETIAHTHHSLLVSLSLVSWLVLYVVLVGFGVWEPTQIITWTIITGVSALFRILTMPLSSAIPTVELGVG